MNSHPDSFYRNWPRPISDGEVRQGIYLRNFDPAEELGAFMATRGHCLLDRGHLLDAIVAYTHAHRLAPVDPNNLGFLLSTLNKELDMQKEGKLPSSYWQAENWDKLLPVSRFVLNSNYTQRTVGVNIDETPGRTIDRN
jgi:hypothetical protein